MDVRACLTLVYVSKREREIGNVCVCDSLRLDGCQSVFLLMCVQVFLSDACESSAHAHFGMQVVKVKVMVGRAKVIHHA